MQFTKDIVIFNTKGKTYVDEKQDRKNWTLRLLDSSEFDALMKFKPRRIRIVKVKTGGKEYFQRDIRHVNTLAKLFGKILVGLTWNPEEEKKRYVPN